MMKKTKLLVAGLLALCIGVGLPVYSVLAQNQINGADAARRANPAPENVDNATSDKEFVRKKLPAWVLNAGGPKSRASDPAKLTPDAPIKLTIALRNPEKRTYLPAEAIPIVLEMENLSTNEVLYGESSPGENYRFDVLDQFGNPMPATLFGRDNSAASFSLYTTSLEPRGKRTVNLTVNQFVDMTIPLRYKIVVQKSFGSGKMIVASNPIIVAVQDQNESTHKGMNVTKREAEIQEELKHSGE